MKITTKTTRQEMLDALNANAKSAAKKDKSLGERVAYTLKHAADATRRDLSDLTKEVITALGEQFVVPAAAQTAQSEDKPTTSEDKPKTENLVKPAKGKNVANIPEKSKKPSTKKKNEGAVAASSPKTAPLASGETFPETLTIDGETFKLAHDVKQISDLADGEYEFAFWWTKRHLKQFQYFGDAFGRPASFPNDLDTAQLIYVSDEGKCAYCVSDATEAFYSVLAADLEEFDGVRVSSLTAIEFQIYRKVEDDDETAEETE